MFVDAYFQVANQLFEHYELQLPLHLFLKEYFKNNKKYGSRDRKYIAELLYGIYRLGKQNEHIAVKDRMLFGAFLSNKLPLIFFEKTNLALAKNYTCNFKSKIDFLKETFHIDFSIPFTLSEQITAEEYLTYLFQPSTVFVRVRKNHQEVRAQLKQSEISFTEINENCWSFEANIKLDEIIVDKSDYVIQDYASQQTGEFFKPQKNEIWWDCCAASGGKSILLLDKCRNIDLTVSDIRESIIKNLHQRFTLYGYASKYVSLVADASNEGLKMSRTFDGIICDAPCSGAGTWNSSPEQYYFFNEQKLQDFHNKQTAILKNVIRFAKQNGKIYFITCSVFNYENQAVLNEILQDDSIQLINQQLIKGGHFRGDHLFIAELLKK
jgi:16S rRNA (cytosine967-C5)-methyltransferase